MPKQLFFLEPGSPSPTRTFETLYEAGVSQLGDVDRIESLAQLDEGVARQRPDALILHWQGASSPHYAVEHIAQSPALCGIPLVVVYTRIDQTDLDFLAEYNLAVGYQVPCAVNMKAVCHAVGNVLDGEWTKAPRAHQAIVMRQFFQHLHAGQFEPAEALLKGDLARLFAEPEQVFLRGLWLKTRKEFDDSMRYLSAGLQLTRKNRTLDPKFLHLIGNVSFKRQDYAQAKQFLEAADRVSPRNLRRAFLLGQLYYEKEDKAGAIAAYKRILAAQPTYPGIHARMVGLLLERAQKPEAVAEIATLLAEVPARKLVTLHKKLPDGLKDDVRDAFLSAVATEYMRHGTTLASADDFYGALNYYQHASRILPKQDRDQKKEILLRCAELHLTMGELALAEKYAKILEQAGISDPRLTDVLSGLAVARQSKGA